MTTARGDPTPATAKSESPTNSQIASTLAASAATLAGLWAFKKWREYKWHQLHKSKGKGPPIHWLFGTLHFITKDGGPEERGYAERWEAMFHKNNYESFWQWLPHLAPTLDVAKPAFNKDIFDDPYRWIKGPILYEVTKDFLGDGIFNVSGPKWLLQRKQAAYVFSERSLTYTMLPNFEARTQRVVDMLSDLKDGESIDLQEVFFNYTMDSFCDIALGWKTNAMGGESGFGENYDAIFALIIKRIHTPVWKIYRFFNIGYERELKWRLKKMRGALLRVISKARETKRDKDTDNSQPHNLLEQLVAICASNGEELDDATLIDFATNFFIAGRDTTAAALTFAIENVLLHPETLPKIRADVAKAREQHPSLRAQLKNMPYLEAWLWESMRHFCPVPAIGRYNAGKGDHTFGDGTMCPFYTRARIQIQCASWNPEVWDNPREFRPERHLDVNGKLRVKDPHEFPLFWGGRRICLGKRMALMNAKLVMSELLMKFDFERSPKMGGKAQHLWLITSKSKNGMHVTVTPRN